MLRGEAQQLRAKLKGKNVEETKEDASKAMKIKKAKDSGSSSDSEVI